MLIFIRRNPNWVPTASGPFSYPFSLVDEMEELSREVRSSWRPAGSVTSFVPHIEMYEEKGELVMKAELPGIKKEDLDITLEDDTLTIKAKKKQEKVAENATYYAREQAYEEYYRSLLLPFHVDSDKISATFENELLELRLPKAGETRVKQIEVKAQIPQGGQKKRRRKPRQPAS